LKPVSNKAPYLFVDDLVHLAQRGIERNSILDSLLVGLLTWNDLHQWNQMRWVEGMSDQETLRVLHQSGLLRGSQGRAGGQKQRSWANSFYFRPKLLFEG